MAKVKYAPLTPYGGLDADGFYDLIPVLASAGGNRAVFVNPDGDNDEIVLQGKNLKYRDGEIVSGSISAITYQNQYGDDYIAISDIKLDAGKLPSLTENFDADLYAFATRGEDKILGSAASQWIRGGKGDDLLIGMSGQLDILDGGKGNDTYSGKGGCDYFVTGPGQGKDVVRDFDPIQEGDMYSQDYFTSMTGTGYEIRKRGHDTIIDFGHGDKLILLDVNRSDIDVTDFNI